MTDHSKNALSAASRTLRETIAINVDQSNPLVLEQLKFTASYLDFLQLRIDHLYHRKLLTLRAAVDLGKKVIAELERWDYDSSAAPLAMAVARADALGALSPPDELEAGAESVFVAIREMLRAAPMVRDGFTRRLEMLVIVHGKILANFERAWYAPLGFDPLAAELPPVTHFFEGAYL